jgi:hypothetical protein
MICSGQAGSVVTPVILYEESSCDQAGNSTVAGKSEPTAASGKNDLCVAAIQVHAIPTGSELRWQRRTQLFWMALIIFAATVWTIQDELLDLFDQV